SHLPRLPHPLHSFPTRRSSDLRPLCCGRTFLAAGLVDEAKKEARRMLEALAPAVASGTPIIGLEPSCLLTLRDEFPSMLPNEKRDRKSTRLNSSHGSISYAVFC